MPRISSLLSLCFFILFSLSACSQNNKIEKSEAAANEGLLWKISGKDLPQPSYLFGTWHGDNTFQNLSFLDSVPYFHQALNSASQYIGEALVSTRTLSDTLPDALFMEMPYSKYLTLKEVRSLDLALMTYLNTNSRKTKLRPRYLMQLLKDKYRDKHDEPLMLRDWSEVTVSVMDLALEQYAGDKGYKLVSLDNEETMALFDRPIEDEIKDLIEMIDQEKYTESIDIPADFTDSIIIAYRRQDMRAIEQQSVLMQQFVADSIFNASESDIQYMNNLRIGRNRIWMKSIPLLIQSQPSFIAVGVRHLPEKDGLINLLREEGYIVEPVTNSSAAE